MAARTLSRLVLGRPATGLLPQNVRNTLPGLRLAQNPRNTLPGLRARQSCIQEQRRYRSHTGWNAVSRANYNQAKADTRKKDKLSQPKDFNKKMLAEMRLPSTFVPLRREEQPQEWEPWFEYQKAIWRRWVASTFARWSLWLEAAGGWKGALRGRSRIKFESGKLVEYAKTMHQRLGNAIANANKGLLDDICTINLAHSLVSGTIARRSPGEKVTWEVVKYNKVRVVAHDIMPLAAATMAQQVVVAIDSTQRLTRTVPNDRAASGTTELDMHENLVLMRSINMNTYRNGSWRIWGTVPGTKLAEYEEMVKVLRKESEDQIKKKYPELFHEKGDD